MKASGALRKNYFRDLRGLPLHSGPSRNSFSSRGSSGKMTMIASAELDGSAIQEVRQESKTLVSEGLRVGEYNAEFVFGPAQTSADIMEIKGKGKVGAHSGKEIGSPIVLKGGIYDCGDVGCTYQGGRGLNKYSGSGIIPSVNKGKKTWVRKIRATGIGDFGNTVEHVQGKRRGDLVGDNDVSVLKSRKVVDGSRETAIEDRCQIIQEEV
ncbi:hypothetical protein LWI29_015926 [Acer saccharum]|uniref:Uncharacterized protein n=1 Tax=Acer saccharum TaxID=4024 RepID=A0AA39SJZ0_ACESA|nr:hypothetical protein LWI29_015926 [Acer saccharum]